MDFGVLTEKYLGEHARYQKLAGFVADHLNRQLREACVKHEMAHRAKDVPNFVKKAIKKGYGDPWDEIRDKAGVRVLVPYHDLTPRVSEVVRDTFTVTHEEDKRLGLAPDQLGYLGIHFEVVVPDAVLGGANADLSGLICEIQVHTRVQNAWSEVSHELIYKPTGEVDADVKRRILRLVALAELFDEEVRRAKSELVTTAGYREAAMLHELERIFLPLAKREYDHELSIDVLNIVKNAYTETELDTFPNLIDTFVDAQRDTLRIIYERYEDDATAHPLLFQPEALAIYERASNRGALLKERWLESGWDMTILDRLTEVFGVPV